MTDEQYRRICALGRCRLAPNSYDKRFCRDLKFKKERALSPNQLAFVESLWNRYRLQLMANGEWEPPCAPPKEPPPPHEAA